MSQALWNHLNYETKSNQLNQKKNSSIQRETTWNLFIWSTIGGFICIEFLKDTLAVFGSTNRH